VPIAAAIIAATVLAALAAACSSGSPSSAGSGSAPNAGSSSSSPSAVAYSVCMRSHGVANFPDPDPRSGETIPKGDAQHFGVSSSQFQAAQQACQPLLPGGSLDQQIQHCTLAGNCPPALIQQMLIAGRTFAQCMRSHGVPNWPDPTLDSQGGASFNLLNVHGFDPNSTQIEQQADECAHVLPPGVRFGWIRPGSPG
jgi:hypothetical protein